MPLEQLIFAALTAGSPLPTSAEDRVYFLIAKEGTTFPRIVYERVSTAPVNGLNGHAGADLVNIQISCWARTPTDANALADEVRAAMAGQTFKAIPVGVFDNFEGESRLYRRAVEFACWDKAF